jgi:uncharacterized DUF497 family protein
MGCGLTVDFDWDPTKDASNERKHGIPFSYATALFSDPNHRDFDVSRTVDNELRRKAIGRIEGQLFTVVYTARDGAVRIISARRSNVQEVRRYGDH